MTAPATDITRGATLGLRQAASKFWRWTSPRLIAASLVVALAARLALGGWRFWDLVIVAAILAVQPFTEWVIHVFLLHFRPRTVSGRQVDPLAAREHRAHHRDPRELRLVFVPIPVLLRGAVVYGAAFLLLLPTLSLGMTAIVTGLAMLLTYEWTHYLIHTSYRPRGRYYRYVWRAHRLHHYRNEHYWFGVTVHLADHVLRTFPAKDEVERSPTARALHEAA